jgi:hypothetical protein
MRPRKIGDALRHSPFGGVVREVCVKIGMIAHLLGMWFKMRIKPFNSVQNGITKHVIQNAILGHVVQNVN